MAIDTGYICEGLGKFDVIQQCQNGHLAKHYSPRFRFCIPCTNQKAEEYHIARKKLRREIYAGDRELRLQIAENSKEYRIKNQAKLKQKRLEKRAKSPEKHKLANKLSYVKNREKGKAYFRMRLYGVTDDQFKKMLTEQNNACAICFEKKELVVDHNHTTGVVRGLLCKGCNLGIGHFSESAEALNSAISYLKVKNGH